MSVIRWLTRRPGGEAGVSLIEMSVAMVVLMAVAPIAGQLMISSARAGSQLQAQSEVLDELRLQTAAIARELRSAECIYEPEIPDGGDSASASRLRFRTNTDGTVYDVTYEVVGDELVRTQGTTSRIVGRALEDGSDAFTHNATPKRTVDLHFRVRVDPDEDADMLRTTIAGRNAWLSLGC